MSHGVSETGAGQWVHVLRRLRCGSLKLLFCQVQQEVMTEPSGPIWVQRFPTSTRTADLAAPFAANVDRLISALRTGGAQVVVSATLRPPQRAHLMHYAWRVARESLDPLAVPTMGGVDIAWAHRNEQGAVDLTQSRSAAALMVSGYGIVFRPALQSNHTQGRAIDMTVTQYVGRSFVDGRGQRVTLHTERDLHSLGASYSVFKLASDPPHWSDDGH